MTLDMPRPRPLHLHKQITRHNVTVWYVRIGKGKRTRIRAAYGTPEFQAEYEAAIRGIESGDTDAAKAKSGTLAWAVKLYQNSSAWLALSAATRRQRQNIFKHVIETAGTKELAKITRKTIIDGRERRAATPFAARNFLETMRGLFAWAVESELVKTNPTEDVKAARPKTDGFPVWTDADIEAFEKNWPIGTRERVAFDILLYTGLRRGDAVTFGKQHIKNGVARLKTEKTGEEVFIPIEPELAATLAAGPCGDLAFICGQGGRPRAKEAFGNWFGDVCKEAGINKSAHGLRKAGATRDANRGFSESELEAKYGWRGGQMASKYTRSMNREKLAIAASERAKKNAT
jgi:integrase